VRAAAPTLPLGGDRRGFGRGLGRERREGPSLDRRGQFC